MTPAVAQDSGPASSPAVPPSEDRTPTRNDYRISLGSYPSEAAARAATAGVGRLGYTVYPIEVSQGVVAQVGPFASREDADRALAAIRAAQADALVYPPRNAPADASAPSQTPAAQTPAAPAPSTPAQSTPAQSTPAPASGSPAAQATSSGPVYLQVAAYQSEAAASKFVERLRGLGFEPTVNAPSGKLVTVLVGPYRGGALSRAQDRLKAGGLDFFQVK